MRHLASALALTATLTAVPVALGASTAVAAQRVPATVSVTDARDDVTVTRPTRRAPTQQFNQSHPLDIYDLHGTRDRGNLVFTVVLDDLTRRNTQISESATGFKQHHSLFTVSLYQRGEHLYDVTRGYNGDAEVTPSGSLQSIDCSPEDDASLGTISRINLKTDTVTYLVPRACLPPLGKIQISATVSNDGRYAPQSLDTTRKSMRFNVG